MGVTTVALRATLSQPRERIWFTLEPRPPANFQGGKVDLVLELVNIVCPHMEVEFGFKTKSGHELLPWHNVAVTNQIHGPYGSTPVVLASYYSPDPSLAHIHSVFFH